MLVVGAPGQIGLATQSLNNTLVQGLAHTQLSSVISIVVTEVVYCGV
jgi:hypothetical protein